MLVSLHVQHFGCVKQANVEFAPGLNVLHGSNDVGKSTLVSAIRAALLLPHNSSAFKAFLPWQEPDAAPHVQLTFRVVEAGLPRFYRVSKHFGQRALLEWSNDGVTFAPDKAAREVDEKLRELLKWGLPAAGAGRGMPDSFLLKVLMASQPEVTGILNAALADDKEPSGKQRILGAMAAMAEDPLFKQVLRRAQERVSEAFSTTGRRRIGKGSPWIEIRDKINAADEEVTLLRTQRDQSATVLAKLGQLDDEVLEAEAASGAAKAQLERALGRWNKQQTLAPLHAQLAHAESVLQEQLQRAEARHSAETRVASLADAVTKATTAVATTVASADAAQAAVTAIEQRIAALQNADAARDAELVASRLRERQTTLQAEIDKSKREGELAQAVGARHAELQSLQGKVLELQRTAEATALSVQELQGSLKSADQDVQRQQARLGLWRKADVMRQLEHAEAAAKTFTQYQHEAVQLRQQAAALEAALNARVLPDEAELSQLRALQAQLAAQEAALNLGLTAVITPNAPPLELGLRVDDGALRTEHLFAAATFVSQRALRLELPGATLALSVGTADSVRALEQLRARWTQHAEPALSAAKVANLPELEAAVRAASTQRDEAKRLHQSATDKEQLAAGLGAQTARVEALRKHAAQLTPSSEAHSALELSAAELAQLEQSLQRVSDEAQFTRALADAEGRRRKLDGAVTSKKGAELATRAQLDALTVQLTALEAIQREAVQRLGADWQTQLGSLAATLKTLLAQKQEVDTALANHGVQENAELAAAQTDRAAALTVLQGASAAVKAQQAELAALQRSLDEQRGQLSVLAQSAEPSQLDAARAAVASAKAAHDAALQACLVDGALLSEAELQNLTAAVDKAEAVARAKRTERDQARGGLMEVGGDVVEEELREATHALAVLKRSQDELEVDYEAWQLLESTLRDAEKSEASNLGEMLGAPLQARFAELTGGRYAALDVGPDLRTTGFLAFGELRQVDTLSAGTQEQLSTLLRLCLAEALETAVILDDHLSQTDSKKMQWFRAALEDVSKKSQVIVITCWPEHYRPPANAIDTARKVDAAAVIERY